MVSAVGASNGDVWGRWDSRILRFILNEFEYRDPRSEMSVVHANCLHLQEELPENPSLYVLDDVEQVSAHGNVFALYI